MFKRSKPAYSSRQPRNKLAPRTAGLYYSSSRNSGPEKTTTRQSALDPKPKTKSSKPKKWQKLPAIFVLIVILGLAFYELGLSSDPKVIILKAQASTYHFLKPSKTYEQAAQKLLQKSFTNRTKLTVNTAAVSIKLQQQFPELASVELALPLIGHQPKLYIEPAVAAAVLNTPANGSYLLSDSGKALQRINGVKTATSGLPVLIDQGNIYINNGNIVLPKTDINFVQLVLAQLKAAHLNVSSLILPNGSDELDVHLANLPYFVKFNLNDYTNADQQIGSFLASQHYLTGKGIVPADYIDVRVDGRAYYK